MTCCVVCGNEPPPDADERCPFCGTLLPPAAAAVALSDQWHRTINLEAGRPQVLQALARLERQLVEARDQGCRVLTLIHGYGSSGSGGVIREAVRRQLRCWLDQGRIAAWLPGEDLSLRGAVVSIPGDRGQETGDRKNVSPTLPPVTCNL